MRFIVLPYLNNPHYSGPIQWARGDVGLKPAAAARPWAFADCEWRAAALGLAARPVVGSIPSKTQELKFPWI